MIKKITLLTILFLSVTSSMAQNSGEVVFYSNSGDKFYVVLNGVRQNLVAGTNVKVESLTEPWYGCKIIAEDNSFSLDKNIVAKKDTLITYRLVSKKGKYKLQYFSETPIKSAPVDVSQNVVVYHATETPVQEETVTTIVTTTTNSSTTTNEGSGNANGAGTINISMNVDENNMGSSTSMSMSETQNGEQSTSNSQGLHSETSVSESNDVNVNTGMNGMGESVDVSISVNETGMNVNMNVGEGNGNFNSNTSVETSGMEGGTFSEESTTNYSESINGNTTYTESTTITTTTTTSSGMNSNLESNEMNNSGDGSTNSVETFTTDCLVDNSAMTKVKTQVEEESFAEDKMRVAKQFVKKKCLTVSQVKEIAELFSFSEDQLNFVKTAYSTCLNKDDYYELMDVFTFSADKAELEKFLDEQ